MKTKRIQINGYPAYCEFNIRTELPRFSNEKYCEGFKDCEASCHLLTSFSHSDLCNACQNNSFCGTCEQCRAENVRTKLVHKHLRRLQIRSFGHDYGDYVVEKVIETSDGEIWSLGS